MPPGHAQAFRGSLADYRLRLLVPALFEGKAATGSLSLSRGAVERTFYLERGFLMHERSNEPKEHLAQTLANLRILDAARAASAFEGAQRAQVPFGTFLVDRGFLERPRVLEALSHKAREAFFDCYEWEAGEIAFAPEKVELAGGVELKLPVGALHRDALARSREWGVFRDVFPQRDLTFEVYREWAAVWSTEEEDALLGLAERGASLAELLAADEGGPLFGARRILQLYRRGVISPRPGRGPRMGEAMDPSELLATARTFLSRGEFESAAAVAAQALERAPVPEAQALYREAEQKLGLAISEQVLALEGRLEFAPLLAPPPSQLTADDLYVYSRLKSARSIRQALRTAAMGELAAYKSVQRLLAAGLLRASPPPTGAPPPRRKTDPFGFRGMN